MIANDKDQPELIRSLLKPDVYDHPVTDIELIETHISWVILTGAYAYKIKKPIDLGFLDVFIGSIGVALQQAGCSHLPGSGCHIR